MEAVVCTLCYKEYANKGEKLGLYSNKPHTPLLTNLTKPLTVVKPQLLPIYTGLDRETSPSFTNLPEISQASINLLSNTKKNHQKVVNELEDLQEGRENLIKRKKICDKIEGPIEKQEVKLSFHSEKSKQSVQQNISECVLENPRHDQVTAYLDSLEEQILIQSVGQEKHRHKSDNCLKKDIPDLSSTSVLFEDCKFLAHDVPVKRNSIPGTRVHTDSIGSSFSLDESVTERARCHVSDVGSTDSSSRPNTVSNDSGFLDHIDAVLGLYSNRSKLSGFPSPHFLNEEDISREVFGEADSDISCCKYLTRPKVVEGHTDCGELGVEKNSKTVTLTKKQLIFILQRVELSKYKAILEERLVDLGTQNKSQRRTLACLIQAIVILNKRLHCERDRWLKLNHAIRQLQLEREVYMHRQARMTVCMCAILCLYLLNLKLVRTRLMSVISYFGIVETVKKINRTRKMIAENWRNIPSLLTNFWRIFIFRYSSKLNTNITGQNKLGS